MLCKEYEQLKKALRFTFIETMDVEKTIRKELRSKTVLVQNTNTLASRIVTHIQTKILEKRAEDKKKAGEHFDSKHTDIVESYCLEEIGAKLVSSFLEETNNLPRKECLATSIAYDDLVRYAQKNKIEILPLALNTQEQEALTLIREHGDDQTLLALRKSFEHLQKEFGKLDEE